MNNLTWPGVRKWKCETCDKSFSHKGSLKVHQVIHEGIAPYKCDLCDKAFTLSGNLSRHKRTHDGQRLYQCGSYCCYVICAT